LRGRTDEEEIMVGKVVLTVNKGITDGTEWVLKAPATCVIGRSSECDVRVLPVAHMDVSRRHCLLDVAEDRVRVRDLESSNGTYVNSLRVRPPDGEEDGRAGGEEPAEAELRDGDVLDLGGSVSFRVRVLAPRNGHANGRDEPGAGGWKKLWSYLPLPTRRHAEVG
jgi:eukaryotic-like serine/threonine-protein kinase